MNTSLTGDIVAEFGAAALTPETVHRAKLGVLDWMGLAVAGAAAPAPRTLRSVMAGSGPADGVFVLGTPDVLSAPWAAYVNAVQAHVDDYDDTHAGGLIHVTTPVLSGCMAVAETRRSRGIDLIAAYVAGVEVAVDLGVRVGQRLADRGFHVTGMLGAFGSAAGVSNLIRLTGSQTTTALGIAATGTGGLESAFGSMTKSLQVGRESMNGVVAALLAEEGFTGPADGISGANGWIATYLPELDIPPDGERHLQSFNGLNETRIKPYPSCMGTHAPIDAARKLSGSVQGQQISEVVCVVGPLAAKVANIDHPGDGLQAKFSLRYCLATALLNGTVLSQDFGDAEVLQIMSLDIASRIRIEIDPDRTISAAEVTVHLAAGEAVVASVDNDVEHVQMSEATCVDKFRSLTARHLGRDAADEIAARVLDLEHCTDVREITKLAATT